MSSALHSQDEEPSSHSQNDKQSSYSELDNFEGKITWKIWKIGVTSCDDGQQVFIGSLFLLLSEDSVSVDSAALYVVGRGTWQKFRQTCRTISTTCIPVSKIMTGAQGSSILKLFFKLKWVPARCCPFRLAMVTRVGMSTTLIGLIVWPGVSGTCAMATKINKWYFSELVSKYFQK